MIQPACNIETTQLLKQSETIKLDIMIIEFRYFYITFPSANSIFSCGNFYLYQMPSLKSQSQVILEKNIKKNGVGDTFFEKDTRNIHAYQFNPGYSGGKQSFTPRKFQIQILVPLHTPQDFSLFSAEIPLFFIVSPKFYMLFTLCSLMSLFS